MRILGALVALLLFVLGGCKDETCQGSFCLNTNAEIAVHVNAEAVYKGSTLIMGNAAVGEKVVGATVRFTNLGDADLAVTRLVLKSSPEGALQINYGGDVQPSAEAPWLVAGTGASTAPLERSFEILLERTDVEATITGTLEISSNSSLNDAMELSFPIEVVDLIPRLNAPVEIQFENVTDGSLETRPLILINDGNADLSVSALRLSGGPAYSVAFDGKEWTGSEEEPEKIEFESPLVVPKGQNITVLVNFAPQSPDPYPGELRLYSNDPETGEEGAAIKLTGNMFGACFTTNPKTVSFGGLPVGKSKEVEVDIISCGTKALEVSAITIAAGDEDEFDVDLSSLPGGGLPVMLDVGEQASFMVIFTPNAASPTDAEGEPIPDIGKVDFMTNTFVPKRQLKMKGSGAQCCACPVAVAQVKQGALVTPQTNIELVGDSSHTPYGEVVQYEWTVIQPEGSTAEFSPSNTVANPTFLANAAGTYTFTLRVWDDDDLESCVPDAAVVDVKPDEAIHVELLWNNELDEDNSDDVGADLDLHFLHPNGLNEKKDLDGDGEPDGYFDAKWDCFWYNPITSWDSPTSDDDDARLDLDDKNGAGPENINLKEPKIGIGYRVGVHYWKEHEMGPADATLLFYVKGELVAELEMDGLLEGQLWDAAVVTWDGEAADVVELLSGDGGPKVFVDYPLPPQLPSE